MSENDECGLNEPFDYTEWRRGLFEGMSLEELLENAKKFSENRKKNVAIHGFLGFMTFGHFAAGG